MITQKTAGNQMQLELAEAKEELANPHTQSTVNEATEHLKCKRLKHL